MTDHVEAVARAIDEADRKYNSEGPWLEQLATAAIAAYQQAVASEAVDSQIRYKLSDGSWSQWYPGTVIQLNDLEFERRDLFAVPPAPQPVSAPAIPAGWKLVRETTAERYGIKTQADLDAFFAKVDAILAAAPTPEAENE